MDAKTIQKYKGRSIAWLVKKATNVFNAWIRARDLDHNDMFKCISCGVPKDKSQMHAGHYMSAGHHSVVRFDERNVNGQCIKCNTFLGGNEAKYRMGLIAKYGLEAVEEIEFNCDRAKKFGYKWDRFYLIEVIEKYK